ncbi:MAG: type III secretion inner membrane ring lipoprotein SctJ [Verrucomicrobiota bacterium]
MRRCLLLTVAPLIFLVSCGKVPLHSNVEEAEANRMLSSLLRADIPAEKVAGEEGMWTIQVVQEEFARADKLLNELGFPMRSYQGIGESFQKSGLVSSPAEERIRFVHALSEELSETLAQIDGVVSARVHIVLPGNDPYAKDEKPASAAVFLKHHPLANLEDSIVSVKELVTNSIEGLDVEKVSVVLSASEPTEDLLPPAQSTQQSILGVSVPKTSEGSFIRLLVIFGTLLCAVAGVAIFLFLRGRPRSISAGQSAS